MQAITTLFMPNPRRPRIAGLVYMPRLSLAGAVPMRMFAGEPVLIRGLRLHKRHTVPSGTVPPSKFLRASHTANEVQGWLPVGKYERSDARYTNAMQNTSHIHDGTFEACGPDFDGNAEALAKNVLVHHMAEPLTLPIEVHQCRTSVHARDMLEGYLKMNAMHGIVWWSAGEPVCRVSRTQLGLDPLPRESSLRGVIIDEAEHIGELKE